MHPDLAEHSATLQEMIDERIPLAQRNACAGAYIKLLNCRRETNWLPWKCKELHHIYEHCMVRMLDLREIEKKKLQKN